MVEFLRRNWGYKLVSFLLAILLWLYVSSTLVAAGSSTDIALQERGLPSNLIVTSKLPTTVAIKLQGNVSPSDAKNIVAYVDLSAAKTGENTYPIIVDTPTDAKVLSVDPTSVAISVDELKEKSFPVQVISQGSVGEGFDSGQPVLRSSSVTIVGPDKELSKIAKVYVEVNLANATDTIQINPVVHFVDAKGNPIVGPDINRPIVAAEPQNISVIIPVIKKGLASRTVPVKASIKGTPAPGFTVTNIIATPEVVTIYGDPDKLSKITYLNGGIIDVSGATKDVINTVKPENLGLPAGVTLQSGVDISVVAHLGPASIERTFKAVPISIKQDLPAGEQATLSQATLDVTIKGTAAAINALQPSDIALEVDASGIASGQQQNITPYLIQPLPPGVTVSTLPQITVSIK